MSDEQKQQGVDLSGEYDVEQPKEAQPKAKTAVPAAVAQTPANGVDLSQDYEVGGKAPKVSTEKTTDTTQPKTISEHPYRDILTHPWESIKNAADYYTRPDEQPKEKPQANPEGAAPQLKVPAPAGLPSAAKLPSIPIEAVNPTSGVPNKPIPKSFTERPIPSLPTDEQITAAHQKMVQKGAEAGKQLGHMWVEGAVNQQGPGGGYYTPAAVEHPKTSEEVQKEHPVAYGVAGGIGEFAGGTVADPVNWALALSGGAEVPVLAKLASAAFSAKMGKDTLEGIKQLRANWDNLNEEQRSEEITKLGLSVLFAEEAGRHVLSGTVTPGSEAANRFAGRDTAGESSIPTIKEAPKKIAGPIVRGVSGAATKVQSALPYVTGVAAGELVGHPWLGAAVGRALFPKEAVARILDTGRMWGLSDEDAAAKWTAEQAADLNKKAQSAKSDLDKFKASTRQGNAPQKYVDAYTKAQRLADEANYHAEEAAKAAQEAKAQKKAPVAPAAAPAPEVPVEQIEAKPTLSRTGQVKPTTTSSPDTEWVEGKEGSWQEVLKEPALGKLGAPKAPPTVSPAHATTTIPQEPTETPKVGYRTMQLPGGEPVGKQLQLTEGTPEGPQVPKGGLPKINLPEVKPEAPKVAPKPERGNLRNLKVDETGKVVEKDAEGERLHQLLIESLKNTKGNENFPAATVEKEAPTEKPAVKTAEKRAGDRRQENEPLPEGQDERRAGERRTLREMNERTFTEGHTGTGGEKRIDTDAYAAATEQARKELGPDATKEAVIARRNELVAPEAKGKTGDIGAQAREANPEPTRAETKGKPVLPKEEPTGYAAKKEEVVPTGEEGREQPTPAAEYHPEVRQRVFELGNEDLKALARAHGLNPDAPEYAFGKGVKRTEATATSSGRQQTGRAKLADDVTAQMSDDEKINIGRNARTMESEGTFKGQDVSNASRAEQARKLFPRLNAEETTGGYGSKNTGVTKEAKDAAVKSFNDKATRSNAGFDPTMLADAAKVAAYHIEAGARAFADFSAKMVEDFGEGIRPYLKDLHTKASEEALGKETAKTSAKDTDHMQAAIKELGPDAKLSDITKRAQELKDESAKPRFKPVGHDEYAKAVKDNPQAATLTDPEAMKNNKAFSNGKGVYYSISPEGDLQGVINNSGDKGALKQAVPHAIANGAKTLDAWDIYLPKQYEKYGFERTKSVPYDAKHYGEPPQNLKDAWKAQGWKEGDPYPSVQYMKLKEGEGPATFEAHHWSNTPDLTETNPEKMGTGVRGAERARMNEPGFLKRTNFGTEGYKEPAVQGQKYHYVSDLEASKYYDAQKDPEGIWKKGFKESGATGAEKAVRDAGYHGYRSGNEVASFEKVPVRPHVEAKPEFSMVTDADGKPDRLEITHNGEPVGHLKIEEQVPGTWTIKDAAVKADAQGQGFGKAAHLQAFEEARQAGAKTVESDVSNSSKENGVWESLKRDHPEAITEENGQYSADLSKLNEKPQGEVPKSLGSASAGTEFGNEEPRLNKLGEKKKKSPYGTIR